MRFGIDGGIETKDFSMPTQGYVLYFILLCAWAAGRGEKRDILDNIQNLSDTGFQEDNVSVCSLFQVWDCNLTTCQKWKEKQNFMEDTVTED